MKVFFNEKNELVDISDIDYFGAECSSIEKEVYDNEYLVLEFPLLGNIDRELLGVNFSIDCLANNIDKDNIPGDVKIFSVLNSDIVDYKGKRDIRNIYISNEYLTHIFIGIDCSYIGDESNIIINFSTNETKSIDVHLTKNGTLLRDKGAYRVDSLSRLMWLNSKLFINEKKSYVYNDAEIDGDVITLSDKKVVLSSDGYIKNVLSFIDESLNTSENVEAELLDGGIRLSLSEDVAYSHYTIEKIGANINIHSIGEGETVTVYNNAKVKYSGVISYNVEVVAKEDTIIEVEEINSFSKYASRYLNGLGHNAGAFESFNFKWSGNNQDSIFIGNVNVGATIKWLSEDMLLPLSGGNYTYRGLIVPSNWDNNKNGGIDVLYERERAKVSAYTGKIKLARGEKKVFSFEIYLTPFHRMYKSYSVKHYENNRIGITPKKILGYAEKSGANVAIMHYNTSIYKRLNYPIAMVEELKNMVANAKGAHINLGIYYNLNAVSAYSNEIKALSVAEDDILFSTATLNKNNSEYINRYLGKYYIAKKKHDLDDDIALQLSPMSRYNNYYVEMVNWLAKECEIRGIQLESGIMDEITIERVRKALDRYSSHIELMLPNMCDPKYGNASAIDRATPLLPYVDTMLAGEGMNYKNMSPEEILLEVSGIPYGISTDLVNVDPFIGMLYGISSRSGYDERTNAKLYKLWDKFDIEGSEMVGWWSEKAIKASDDNVKITYYKKGSKALICMYNFNNYPAVFTVDYSPLNIDGVMKSFPMSKLIMNQKFSNNTTVVIYNKCGLFLLADIK